MSPFLPDLRARLPQFIGARPDAADALRALKVALVGVGSVGRGIAFHLARFGGILWLVDRGRLKPESQLTHPGVGPADIGEPKASNLARALAACGFCGQGFAHDGPVEELPLVAFADADLVVLASDNLRAEVEVGRRCAQLGKPLLQASVHGDTLVAQVRFFSGKPGSPCPACGYTKAEWQAYRENRPFKCEPLGWVTPRQQESPPPAPTMSTSFLCSLAADMAMVQITRFALGLGAPVADTLVEYAGYTHRTVVSPLACKADCPGEHLEWRQVRLGMHLGDTTLRSLAATAGFAPRSFEVDDYTFAERGGCGCPTTVPLGRFVTPGEGVEQCAACGCPIVGHPFYLHRPVPASAVEGALDRPLSSLGAGAARWAAVRGDDRAVLLFHGPDAMACWGAGTS